MQNKFNFQIIAPNYLCTCIDADCVCEKIIDGTKHTLTEKERKAVKSFCSGVKTENETLNLGEVTVVSVLRGKK